MAQYFISNVGVIGNDSNNGLSEATPWLTSDKITSGTFLDGDIISFHAGGTYGAFDIPDSGVTINSYGVGAKPIISGFVTTSGWVNTGGNIWEYENLDFQDSLNVLLIDGVDTPKGRIPKTGFYRVDSFVGNESITSTSLASQDFTGGEVVIRKNAYIDHLFTADSHVGSTINYGSDLTTEDYVPQVGYGFFIQNHVDCLTVDKDWWFDKVTKKLYIYFDGSVPSDYVIKVSITQDLIEVANDDILIQDLVLEGANGFGISGSGLTNLSIEDSEIRYCGYAGLVIIGTGSNFINVLRSTIRDIHGNGISIFYTNENVTVDSCIIKDIYIFRGGGGVYPNSDSRGIPISIPGSPNTTIKSNIISNSGFNGIDAMGDALVVEYNHIENSNMLKSDGGAIYGYVGITGLIVTTRGLIRFNVISNIIGTEEGMPVEESISGLKLLFAMYADDNCHNLEYSNNKVFNSKGSAFYGHNCYNINIFSNHFFGNNFCTKWAEDNGLSIHTIQYNDNHHYLDGAGQVIVSLASGSNNMNTWGSFYNNSYYVVNDNVALFEANYGQTLPYNFGLSMEEWASLIGETDYILEFFGNVVPDVYEPVEVIGENTYSSAGDVNTFGKFGAFTFVDGGTVTWVGGKAKITKTVPSSGLKGAYMVSTADIEADKSYVLSLSISSTSPEKPSVNFEHSFGSAYSYPRSKQLYPNSTEKHLKLYFTGKTPWVGETILFLMENGLTDFFVDNVKLEEVDFELDTDLKYIYNQTGSSQIYDLGGNYKNLYTGLIITEITLDNLETVILAKVHDFIPVDPSIDPSRRIPLWMIEDFQNKELIFEKENLFKLPPRSEIDASEDTQLVKFSQIKDNHSILIGYGLSLDPETNELRTGDFEFGDTLFTVGANIPFQIVGNLYQSVADEDINVVQTIDKGTASSSINTASEIINFSTGDALGLYMRKTWNALEYALELRKTISGLGVQSIELTLDNRLVVVDDVNSKGFENGSEYEAQFTNLSLTTVKYIKDYLRHIEENFTYIALADQDFTLSNEPALYRPRYVWIDKVKLEASNFFITGSILTITSPTLAGGELIEIGYEYYHDFTL